MIVDLFEVFTRTTDSLKSSFVGLVRLHARDDFSRGRRFGRAIGLASVGKLWPGTARSGLVVAEERGGSNTDAKCGLCSAGG